MKLDIRKNTLILMLLRDIEHTRDRSSVRYNNSVDNKYVLYLRYMYKNEKIHLRLMLVIDNQYVY
jgi:hypothetical protein